MGLCEHSSQAVPIKTILLAPHFMLFMNIIGHAYPWFPCSKTWFPQQFLTAIGKGTNGPALWHPAPKALSSPTESLLLLLTMQLWVVLQAVVVTAWSWKLHQGAKSVNESKWPSTHSDEMSRVRIATTRGSFFCMISVWKLLDFICVHKDWIKKSHMPSMCFVSKPQSQYIRLKGSNIFILVMGYVEKFSLGFHTP